ncbi:zinc-binding dehydrogenase [Microbacterium sp. No. 7]|uniref:zinc-binding dehydrogenase n=1 Tax=Microbacterium sp. No. 7 TaxID=1714373 RepID=UPI0006D1B233|nr:zinc-binding dehydrogenase [Microbacterium sp. No. 7]ALJ19611.1 hypothetical protein AOA12_06675 [Microbacterium sp. No. 7]
MSTVIIQHGQGGPEVLRVESRDLAAPGAGQVIVEQRAVGFNYLDVMLRSGIWPISEPTIVPGFEAAGVVTDIGPDVHEVAIGDRVGYFRTQGSYAAERTIDQHDLIRIPETVAFDQAAALLTKGLMARITVRQAHEVTEGQTVLVTTAAGGIGSLVTRWATSLGARVIGVVGSPAKREAALSNGASDVAVGVEEAVRLAKRVTHGLGVDAVLDGLGADTPTALAGSVRPGGSIVSFGSAAGWPSPDADVLNARQIRFTLPQFGQYLRTPTQAQDAADDVFRALLTGSFGDTLPATTRPLVDVARLHADVEARRATGLNVLIP